MEKTSNIERVLFLLAGGVIGATLLYAVNKTLVKENITTNTNDVVSRVTCYSGPLKIYDNLVRRDYSKSWGNYKLENLDTGKKSRISGATCIATDFNAQQAPKFKATSHPDGIQFGNSTNETFTINKKVPKPTL